jgi:hypothetical protein
MINLLHRNGSTGLERSRYSLDIQDLSSSKIEPTYAAAELAQVCPGCASEVNSEDRFCQECGTRIGTNRQKRSNIRDKSERAVAEPGSASVICINCGTTNKALSTVCGDCKIPLVPTQRRRDDRLVGEQTGLRGSLTNRSNRPFSKTAKSPSKTVSESVSLPDNPPQIVSETTTVVETNASKFVQKDSLESQQPEVSKPEAAAQKRVRVKQRLPGFISPIFKKTNLSDDTTPEGAALDFLFADANPSGQVHLNPFERLISETRSMGGAFSISTVIYTVESFFDRIPLPLLFLALSFVIICVTANATTQWNRYEQRLRAMDRIAANCEEEMRSFQLDKVIAKLQDLEKTEKGDLPPRARAVLDQSLWLRSYSYAKQHEYAKAIADLSFVTSAFASFEDVTERLVEYKKLLARHPEFAGAKLASEKTEVLKSKKERNKTVVEETAIASTVSRKQMDSRSKPGLIASRVNERQSSDARISEKKTIMQDTYKETVPTTVTKATQTEKSTGRKDTDKRPVKSQAAHLDRDMKRYSNLLVEYFSKAESGDSVAEPPSYEEWTSSGKHDF